MQPQVKAPPVVSENYSSPRLSQPSGPVRPMDLKTWPREIILMVLSYLSIEDRTKAKLACRRFYNLDNEITLYHKGELQGRIKVLRELNKKFFAQEPNPAISNLLDEAIAYLANPKSNFNELILPDSYVDAHHHRPDLQVRKLFHIFKSKLRAKPSVHTDLCVRLQKAIEETVKTKGFKFDYLHNVYGLDLESQDQYEKIGIIHAMRPIVLESIKEFLPHKGIIGTIDGMDHAALSLKTFNLQMEVVATSPQLRFLEFNSGIEGIDRIDQLEVLNRTLPLCRRLEAISFTARRMDSPKWLEGPGLSFIEKSLISLPRLERLIFYMLKCGLDQNKADFEVKDIQDLVRIVKARAQNPQVRKIKRLEFGEGSLHKQEAALALLEGLKDYKHPLCIYYGYCLSLQPGETLEKFKKELPPNITMKESKELTFQTEYRKSLEIHL